MALGIDLPGTDWPGMDFDKLDEPATGDAGEYPGTSAFREAGRGALDWSGGQLPERDLPDIGPLPEHDFGLEIRPEDMPRFYNGDDYNGNGGPDPFDVAAGGELDEPWYVTYQTPLIVGAVALAGLGLVLALRKG